MRLDKKANEILHNLTQGNDNKSFFDTTFGKIKKGEKKIKVFNINAMLTDDVSDNAVRALS